MRQTHTSELFYRMGRELMYSYTSPCESLAEGCWWLGRWYIHFLEHQPAAPGVTAPRPSGTGMQVGSKKTASWEGLRDTRGS